MVKMLDTPVPMVQGYFLMFILIPYTINRKSFNFES